MPNEGTSVSIEFIWGWVAICLVLFVIVFLVFYMLDLIERKERNESAAKEKNRLQSADSDGTTGSNDK
jgi:uncharacterized membrane protein YjfL (UPF0719 family)